MRTSTLYRRSRTPLLASLALLATAAGAPGCALFGVKAPAPARRAAAATEEEPDNGITSETHRKHVGEVVFSTRKIRYQKENEAAFVSRASVGQPLWSRVYMERSMLRTLRSMGSSARAYDEGVDYTVAVSVDGEPASEWSEHFGLDAATHWTTFQVFLAPWTYMPNESIAGWGRAIGSLPPGEHQVRVSVRLDAPDVGRSEVVAAGELALRVTEAGLAAYREAHGATLPPSMIEDPALEAAMVKAFNGDYEGQRALAARIRSGGWAIAYDERGDRVTKQIRGLVVIHYEDDDRCATKIFTFCHDAIEARSYDDLRVCGAGGAGDQYIELACADFE